MVSKKSNKSIRNRIKNKRGGCKNEDGTDNPEVPGDEPCPKEETSETVNSDNSDSGSGSNETLSNEVVPGVGVTTQQFQGLVHKAMEQVKTETAAATTAAATETETAAATTAAATETAAAESPEKAAAKTELDAAQKALDDMGEETPENKDARDAAVAEVERLTTEYNNMTGGRRRSRRRSGKNSKKNSKKSSARKSKKGGRSRKNGSKRRAHRKH